MKTRLLALIDALRVAGVRISVSETLDAMEAVARIGVERTAFREALAATLVKDEADRPAFDEAFAQFFSAPGRTRKTRQRERNQTPSAARGHGSGDADGASPRPDREPSRGQRPAGPERNDRPHPNQSQRQRAAEQLTRRRAVRTMSFRTMTPRDVEECAALVADLARRFTAHLRRRERAASRCRIDIRRTIRRSLGSGGIPMNPAFRARSPGRPDLVVLCDCSHSVSTASRFLCSLVAPAAAFFRRVSLLGYVDVPVELSYQGAHLVPHGTLDLYGRSDFGRTLEAVLKHYGRSLTRNTIVLILGDARNNRRPPRQDLLKQIGRRTRRIIWLNPDDPRRWNTGDSVMASYAPHCDAVLAASSIATLTGALRLAFLRNP